MIEKKQKLQISLVLILILRVEVHLPTEGLSRMGMNREAEKAQPMTCLGKVLKIKRWKLVHMPGFIKRNLEWLE